MLAMFHFLVGSADPDVGGLEESAVRIARHLGSISRSSCIVYSRQSMPESSQGAVRFETLARDRRLFYEPLVGSGSANDASEGYRLDGLLFHARVEAAMAAHRDRRHVIVSFFLSSAGFIAQQVAVELGLPHIASVRGTDFTKDAHSPYRVSAIKYIARNAAWLVTTNARQERWFRTTGGRKDGITTILNGAPEAFRACEPWRSRSDGSVRLIADGGLTYRKASHLLISAVEDLRNEGLPVTLRVFGNLEADQGRYWSSLLERYNGSAEWFTFGGRIDEHALLNELVASDVYCSTSLTEGCSNGANKALVLGLPIVATRTGALPDLADGADHVALTAVASPHEYVDALRTMVRRILASDVVPNVRRIQDWRNLLSEGRERLEWEGVVRKVLAPRVHISTKRKPRVLFFAHDGTGLGHLQRLSRIARALQGPCACLVVTGHRAASWIVPDASEYVHLPSLDSFIPRNARYWGREPFIDGGLGAAQSLRSKLLDSIFDAYAPDAVVVDHLPLGKHEELARVLDSSPARKYFVMRGVMDNAQNVRLDIFGGRGEEMLATHFDRILVACDRRICDVVEEYALGASLASKVSYVGYVADPVPKHVRQHARAERGLAADDVWVVCSAGGGVLGEKLASECVRLAGASRDAVFDVVYGPRSGTPWAPVFETVSDGRTRISQQSAHLSVMHAAADVVVCPGGYNSLVEALQGEARVISVPVQLPGVQEQRIHGERLAHHADIRVASSFSDLKGMITDAIGACRLGGPATRHRLDMNGAATVRDIIFGDLTL